MLRPQGKYGDLVRKLRPGAIEAGDIVDTTGKVLGQHQGVIDFTIGQRKGLGIGGRGTGADENTPLYVVAIRPEHRQVVVGKKEDLACVEVVLRDINWLGQGAMIGREVLARLRNTAAAEPAEITAWEAGAGGDTDGGGSAIVRLLTPQYGIATGQAAALYDRDDTAWLLGGGWIAEAKQNIPLDEKQAIA